MYANMELFQSVYPEQDWNIVKERIGFRKTRKLIVIWRAAAVALIVLGVGFLTTRHLWITPATIHSISGTELKEVLLPDGSSVTLNKHSELAYPERFSRNRREVTLSGEGFFMVSHDSIRPFIIHVADEANVEVLGTSFNIQHSSDNQSIHVQVVEGKVAFYSIADPEQIEVLEKDDQATLKDGLITRNSSVNRNFLSWKTGIFYFEQEEISKVVETLGYQYDREIILDESVDRELRFTSIIDNQDLESVLEEMSLVLGISYTLDSTRVEIYMSD